MIPKMSVAVAVLASLASTSVAFAQSCIGQLSLDKVHINGVANVHMVSQGNGGEARVALGNSRLFGNAGLGAIRYDHGNTMTSYITGIQGGYSVVIPKVGLQVCPVASFSYENGPDNIAVARNTFDRAFGVFAGGAVPVSSSVALVMFGGGGYQGQTQRSKYSVSPARSYFTRGVNVQTGIGLQLREQYLLRVVANAYVPRLPDGVGTDAPVRFLIGLGYSRSPAK